MKKLVVLVIILLAVAIPLVSYAGGNNNQNNSDINYYTTNYDNRAYNNGGAGGRAEANSTNLNSNRNENENLNLNSNVNSNKNDNTNLNLNSNRQGQAQAQGQLQGQAQGQSQGQSQSANNEGNHQTLNQSYEDKRDLINPPPVPMVDPKLTNAKAGSIKTHGSLWMHMSSIKKSQAVKVIKGAGIDTLMGPDVKVDVRAVSEKDFQTDVIRLENKTPEGAEYLATIYVYSTGADAHAVDAVAIIEAMKLGGTHIVYAGRDAKVVSSGSSWSVGFGGGASAFAKGDDIALAPSGGTGIGRASASNENLPEGIFTVYCDAKLIKK